MGAMRIPFVQDLANLTVKNLINLSKLTIREVKWHGFFTLGFTLSNGESCTAGSSYKVDQKYKFDPKEKITKVEVIINKTESFISQINFYSGEKRLVAVGYDDDWLNRYGGNGRVE